MLVDHSDDDDSSDAEETTHNVTTKNPWMSSSKLLTSAICTS